MYIVCLPPPSHPCQQLALELFKENIRQQNDALIRLPDIFIMQTFI